MSLGSSPKFNLVQKHRAPFKPPAPIMGHYINLAYRQSDEAVYANNGQAIGQSIIVLTIEQETRTEGGSINHDHGGFRDTTCKAMLTGSRVRAMKSGEQRSCTSPDLPMALVMLPVIGSGNRPFSYRIRPVWR